MRRVNVLLNGIEIMLFKSLARQLGTLTTETSVNPALHSNPIISVTECAIVAYLQQPKDKVLPFISLKSIHPRLHAFI